MTHHVFALERDTDRIWFALQPGSHGITTWSPCPTKAWDFETADAAMQAAHVVHEKFSHNWRSVGITTGEAAR